MKMSELSRKTGISKNALSLLYHEQSNGVRFDTLEKICNALSCTIADLLEHIPKNQTENTNNNGVGFIPKRHGG